MKPIIVLLIAVALSLSTLSANNAYEQNGENCQELELYEVLDDLQIDLNHETDLDYYLNQDYGKVIILSSNTEGFDEEEFERKMNEAMRKVEEATSGLAEDTGRTATVHIDLSRKSSSSPYVGVVTDDLTLSEAANRGYNKFYGVRISRVVDNSPARHHRLLPDDIIMEIDGQRVTDKRIFSNMVDSYNDGDTVKLKIFRNREELVMDFTFGSRGGDPSGTLVHADTAKKKLPVGDLGGGWIPMWYTPEMDDVNKIVTDFGFTALDEEGLFLNGGGGKINIGGSLFLGGMGVGYSLERKTQVEIDDESLTRRLRYGVGFGGVTLEHRVPFSRKIITSVGTMLGWGKTTIEISQNDGDYTWGNLSTQFEDSYNNYLHLSRSFIMLQPKAEIFYRLNSWLGFRGEVGYVLSYSYHSGWNVDDSGEVYEVKQSPDTSFNGLTVSIGPWFGF
jgi:hypothetical protein